MIKAIANKRLDISSEEFENYKNLIEIVDKQELVGLFETDNNGFITSISVDPSESISMATIMFVNQVMMNQRFRIFLSEINKNREEINKLSEKLRIIEATLEKGG